MLPCLAEVALALVKSVDIYEQEFDDITISPSGWLDPHAQSIFLVFVFLITSSLVMCFPPLLVPCFVMALSR